MNQILVNTRSISLQLNNALRVGYGFVLMSTEQSNTGLKINGKQIADIRNTPIRVYETKFRQNYSKHYWTAKDYVYDRVWKAVAPTQAKSARNTVNGCMADIFTSFFFPLTRNANNFVTLAEMNCWYFLTDDYIGVENTKEAFDQLCDAMVGRKTPEKPNEIIIDGINQSIRQCYSDVQYKRYLDSQSNYLVDCSKELQSGGIEFGCVEELIEFRDNLIAVKPGIYLIPFEMEIDVTEYADNPALNRMESLAVKHVILVNDVYSANKEFAQRESVTPFNALLFLYSQLNCLHQSMDKLFLILDSYESEFFELRDALRTQYPNSSELHQYMDGLEYMAGGNLMWSLCAPRYNRKNGLSLRETVFKHRFAELIPQIERYDQQFTTEMN